MNSATFSLATLAPAVPEMALLAFVSVLLVKGRTNPAPTAAGT